MDEQQYDHTVERVRAAGEVVATLERTRSGDKRVSGPSRWAA
jgi:hypothetical protein